MTPALLGRWAGVEHLPNTMPRQLLTHVRSAELLPGVRTPALDRDAAVHRAGPRARRLTGSAVARFMAFGLALDAIAFAWTAYNAKVSMSYEQLLPALVLAGIGTASFFATGANMGAVRREEAGQASGATNAIREIGGVFGIAVLAAVFSARVGYATPSAFVDGFVRRSRPARSRSPSASPRPS